jgi:hypothetical protein
LLIALELGEGRYYTKYQKPGVVTVWWQGRLPAVLCSCPTAVEVLAQEQHSMSPFSVLSSMGRETTEPKQKKDGQ